MQDKQNENIRLEHMVRYVNVMDYYKMIENTWFYQPQQKLVRNQPTKGTDTSELPGKTGT